MSDEKKTVIIVNIPDSQIASDLPANTPKIVITNGTK